MSIELRPEVQAFAESMERKLRKNEHKGGWKNEKPAALFIRAAEEFKEADEAVSLFLFDGRNGLSVDATGSLERMMDELVDVSNFLMMVADVCGGLEHE